MMDYTSIATAAETTASMKIATWVRCDCGCGGYWCQMHDEHVVSCLCPALECWDGSTLGRPGG